MAKTTRGLDEQKSSLMFIEMTPPHGWKEDSDFHYLQLTLPGFEAKDVHLRVNKYGNLVVRGDKQVSEHKYITFEETFDAPKEGDLENADGLFKEGHIYCVTIPKIKGGKGTAGHSITIPHDIDNNNPKTLDSLIPKHEDIAKTNKPKNNPLQVIRGDKSSKKKIAMFIAVLIALLVAVALIVKFHR